MTAIRTWSAAAMPPLLLCKGGHAARPSRGMAARLHSGGMAAALRDLTCFMQHLEHVEMIDGNRSHWMVKGPAGLCAEWDAEVINEVPNELIAWRSVDGSNVQNAGSVHFKPAPGNRGTEVKIVLRYDPPGGTLGAAIAKLFGEEPSRAVREDLRRLKQILESGEVATTLGQVSGATS